MKLKREFACERNERNESKAEMTEIYDDVTMRQ